ncbi:MAG: ROK family protein [Planctomycetaceae bacterium]|nr:ROK family protein [Planctomycetaceae bacterium]
MVAAAPQSYWLGFDLGGTKMHAVLFDAQMQPVVRRRKKTRGHEGAEAGIDRICGIVEKLLEEAKITRGELSGIGLGVPGPVDMDTGVILEAPNLGWTQVPLQELLEQRFGCPVAICNDVDAGVYGEYQFGAARGARTALGVFPGTGIGGGLIYEGRIFRGRSSSCLEIGHMPVVLDGAPCGCGRRGCLETVASRLAMSAEIAKAAYRGQAPHLLRVAGTDLANIRSGILAEAIAAGDQIVEQIVRTGARHLGMAIAGCVNLLLPDCIVLGGGLVESLPKLYLEEVAGELKQRVMPAFGKSFVLKTAELGDDAGVLGAAAWARQTLASSMTPLAELASVE